MLARHDWKGLGVVEIAIHPLKPLPIREGRRLGLCALGLRKSIYSDGADVVGKFPLGHGLDTSEPKAM